MPPSGMWRHVDILLTDVHRRENLKSYNIVIVFPIDINCSNLVNKSELKVWAAVEHMIRMMV
jgi:hypothetical protein